VSLASHVVTHGGRLVVADRSVEYPSNRSGESHVLTAGDGVFSVWGR
jgi:hypothetical protein